MLDAEASHLDHTATVTYDIDRTDPEIMKEVLAKEEYPVKEMRFLK